jgi:hypothetical protein
MSDTGKQSPLGVNSMAGILQNKGYCINKVGVTYMGVSHDASSYSFGSLINNTVLRLLTWAINDSYGRGVVDNGTYQHIISIGAYGDWYAVTNPAWGSFMNSYAIWTNGQQDVTTNTYSTTVNFPVNGLYSFKIAADNSMVVNLDGVSIGTTSTFSSYDTITLTVAAGNHVITLDITNSGGPAGGAVEILKPDATELWNTRTYLSSVPGGGIPGLGNSKPPTFTWTGDPSWGGTRYTGQVASWGYLRLYPWQAWNEFNYNNTLAYTSFYTDFLGSFMASSAFIEFSNQAMMSMQNSVNFLKGTYSNMDDLISSDITGVTLAGPAFGQDLIALGRAIELPKIKSFGYPSNLLATLKKNNALTPSVVLALLASGLTPSEVETVANNVTVTKVQQQQTYAAFLVISGIDLDSILVSLNCKTKGLETLADLLNIKKIFPTSYQSLTVPVYNANPGPTNSKTYYPLYVGTGVNLALSSDTMKDLVGTIIPPNSPTTQTAPGATTSIPNTNTAMPTSNVSNTPGTVYGTTTGRTVGSIATGIGASA